MTDHAHLGSPMMTMDYREDIKAYAQRSLGGQTPIALRQYSFSYDKAARIIVFKAEVDRDLTENEHENLEVSVTEVYAAIYDNI